MRNLDGGQDPVVVVDRTSHEEERRRLLIAADVHDDSVQAMLAADLKLEALKRLSLDATLPLVEEIQEIVRGAAHRLRQLLFEVAPIEPGVRFPAAVQRYIDKCMGTVACCLVNRLSFEPPAGVANVAYRIIQEALTNIRTHSSATSARVELREENEGLLVEIRDNGRGFEARTSPSGHLGLTAMRHRAEQAGGWLAIDSRPGSGAIITFWLELPQSNKDSSPIGHSRTFVPQFVHPPDPKESEKGARGSG